MSDRERFSQIFLKSEELVGRLVDGTSITKDDVVLEIGPGKGVITDKLIQKAKSVIAIEKDPNFTRLLQQKYGNTPNIKIINTDILRYHLPDFPYKVFSNIPFAIEGQLIRIFLNTPSGLEDGYLFMRREYAMRFAGIPRESQFHITYGPWFDIEIFRSLRREDFQSRPLVETDILRFKVREEQLLGRKDKPLYEAFVMQGYGNGPTLRQSLTPRLLSREQLSRLAQNLDFNVTDKPSDLVLDQWVGMFKFYSSLPIHHQQRFTNRARK